MGENNFADPLCHDTWIVTALPSYTAGASDTRGFPRHGIVTVRVSQVVMEGDPHGNAAPRRITKNSKTPRINVVLLRLRAKELHRTCPVMQRSRERLCRDEAVVGSRYGYPNFEAFLEYLGIKPTLVASRNSAKSRPSRQKGCLVSQAVTVFKSRRAGARTFFFSFQRTYSMQNRVYLARVDRRGECKS